MGRLVVVSSGIQPGVVAQGGGPGGVVWFPACRWLTPHRPAGDAAAASGAKAAWRRLAAKVAAWSTIPASTYRICAARSLPLEQTGSSGAHKSMVLAAYHGPTVTCGRSIAFMNRMFGFPSSATAATWFATSGGIGAGTVEPTTPSGMASAVTKPITAAPWENPPSTNFVLGQFTDMART